MTVKQSYTCIPISDFNLQNFVGYVANDPEFPDIKPITVPFGQPIATLANRELPCWQKPPDVALVWTQPQSVISSVVHVRESSPHLSGDLGIEGNLVARVPPRRP